MIKILKSKFFKQLISYTGFLAIEKLLPFLLLPIFTRILPQDQIGYYVTYQAINVVFFPLFTLGTQTSLSVNFFRLSKERYKRYFTSVILFAFIFILFILFVFSIFKEYISNLLSFPSDILLISVCIIFPQFIILIRQTLYRNQNKPISFGILGITNSFLSNGLGLILILIYQFSWHGIIYGLLIGNLIISIYSIITFYKEKYFIGKISKLFIKDSLKIGFPVSFHQIGIWLSNAYNRIIINRLMGASATGNYGIGATFSMILTFIQESFNHAYVPYLYNKLKYQEETTQYCLVKFSVFSYISIFILAVFISFFGYFFVDLIFGELYSRNKMFIIPLVASSMFNGFYKIHVSFLFYYKHTIDLAKITFTLGIINIFIAFLSVKYFGLLGAAYSTLLIQIMSYLFVLRKANYIFPMNWKINIIKLLKY